MSQQEAETCDKLRKEIAEMASFLQAYEEEHPLWRVRFQWYGQFYHIQTLPDALNDRRLSDFYRSYLAPLAGEMIMGVDMGSVDKSVVAAMMVPPGQPDIHTAEAARMYGVTPAQVNADMRRVAKHYNFGKTYGMSGDALEKVISRAPTQGIRGRSKLDIIYDDIWYKQNALTGDDERRVGTSPALGAPYGSPRPGNVFKGTIQPNIFAGINLSQFVMDEMEAPGVLSPPDESHAKP